MRSCFPGTFPRLRNFSITSAIGSALLIISLTGCGVGSELESPTGSPVAHHRLSGSVFGGQQPVSGSQVYLYAASSAANAGSATSLLASPGYVLSDVNGNFAISNAYTCPAGAYVYLLAVGGNPGLGPSMSNPEIALAAGLGACSSLSTSSSFSINEVTTIAAAYSMAPLATSETQIGSTSAIILGNAFSNIPSLIDPVHGAALAATPTGNGAVPQAKIDSLANSLAACINSDGTGTPCSTLMSAAGVSGSGGTPVDTFQAALNIAQNPTANVTTIYDLATANTVFQPSLSSAPSDWTLTVQYPATVSLAPGASSIVTGAQQGFTANISGGPGTTLNYQWSTTATSGTLTDTGGSGTTGQTTYCSSSAQTTYVSNGATLTANASDNVTVQVFSGTGCVAANALGTATSIQTVLPAANNVVVPTQPVNTTQVATVVLPAGVNFRPDQLTVLDSLSQVTPAPSGTFSLPTYTYASQIAVVLNPNGNPILMGWLDPTHQTLSAGTTAEVLAYFALGGPLMFTVQDREGLEAAIVSAPGLPALTQAISNELAANPDALKQLDPVIQSALNTFFTSVSGVTPMTRIATGARVNPNIGGGGGSGTGILIQPGDQSGVFIEQGNSANNIDATNRFRRRAHVFVDRVSDTDASGSVTADPGTITDFDLSPTNGLSGGVAGTVQDIFNSYWGSGTTAYAPVTSDAVVVPVTSGFTKTTYTVTVVGAGGNTPTYALLTSTQANQQVQTAVTGFISDALVPFLSNYIFGSGFFSNQSGALSFQSTWQTDLQNDFLNFIGGVPALQTQITSGDYRGALFSVVDNIRQAGSLRDLVVASLEQAAGKNFTSATTAAAMQSINVILNAAGGVLQIYDSSIMAAQLLQSDAADQWTVVDGGQKVTLTPASTSLSQFGTSVQNLTVALPGVSSTTNYSYYWTNTANAGDIAPADGSGSASAGFCTADATVTYSVHTTPILQQTVTDKIFVQAFSSGGCRAANQVGTSTTAIITVGPDAVTLTPQNSTISQTSQQTLTANVTGGTGSNYSYQYTLAGLVGTAPVGTITDGSQTATTFCSSLTTVTYTPNPSPVLTQNATDGVTVKAFTGSGCNSANLLGTASTASITVTASGLLITPHNPRIPQTTSESFVATLTTAVQNTTYTYQWNVSGSGGGTTLGSLAEGGGGSQTGVGFCSTSNNVSYTPNPTPILSTPGSDVLSVQAFTGTGCVGANAVSGVISTTVTVAPSPTSRNIPLTTPIYNVMEASDGNYYAGSKAYGETVAGASCPGTASSAAPYPCGAILQITQSGTQNVLHQFPSDASAGVQPGMLLEGPDGLLYGVTADGIFFSISTTGTYTALSQLPSVSAYAQNLLLGSDGYFYMPEAATQLTNTASILRIGTDGQYEVVYTIDTYVQQCSSNISATPTAIISDFVEGADGDFYVAMAPDCTTQEDGGAIVQLSRTGAQTVAGIATLGTQIPAPPYQFRNLLAQAADGNFYYVVYVYSAFEDVIRATTTGSFSSAYRFFIPYQSGTGYSILEPGFQVASDGNLYGDGAIVANSAGVAPSPCNNTVTSATAGANCFFKTQLTTGGGYSELYSFGAGSQGTYPDGANGATTTQTGIQNDLGELVGGAENYYQLLPPAVLYQINNHLAPPIQLTFSQSPVSANQPVTLSWNVLDAFSLTARQCYAFVDNGATGAGTWTGKQYGTASQSGYAGQTTITPTAPGTYTYALTCGGRESGFATLVVQ